ncbi:hypothetical protein N7540_012493 [Penicillium herquei]|nr:hypothetical protein N7540_012493 [Penicillium herquei]
MEQPSPKSPPITPLVWAQRPEPLDATRLNQLLMHTISAMEQKAVQHDEIDRPISTLYDFKSFENRESPPSSKTIIEIWINNTAKIMQMRLLFSDVFKLNSEPLYIDIKLDDMRNILPEVLRDIKMISLKEEKSSSALLYFLEELKRLGRNMDDSPDMRNVCELIDDLNKQDLRCSVDLLRPDHATEKLSIHHNSNLQVDPFCHPWFYLDHDLH